LLKKLNWWQVLPTSLATYSAATLFFGLHGANFIVTDGYLDSITFGDDTGQFFPKFYSFCFALMLIYYLLLRQAVQRQSRIFLFMLVGFTYILSGFALGLSTLRPMHEAFANISTALSLLILCSVLSLVMTAIFVPVFIWSQRSAKPYNHVLGYYCLAGFLGGICGVLSHVVSMIAMNHR